MSTDHNLLFGVLALQADLLDAARFAEACTLWSSRKQTPLADLLVERGWLTAQDRADVEKLLQRKLDKHRGDARAGLAEVTSDEVRRSLAGVEDKDVRQSLADRPTHPAPPELGSTTAHQPEALGRYTLTRLHAQGGIGQVWLARDTALGRDVALKELRPERQEQAAARARFLEEAIITGQLEHPGIVPVHELVQDESDRPFYTMRMVRGRTLAEAIKEYHQKRQTSEAGPLELRGLLTVFVAACNAVAYAHSRGVLHRDLKPSNVVLGDFGEVVVLDWGLAKLLGRKEDNGEVTTLLPVSVEVGARDETMQGQVLGTPAYMAPEQAEGRPDLLAPATDVYGLGAVLYEILTDRAPFVGGPQEEVLRRVVRESPERPRQCVPAVPAALEAVCLKALAKKQAARYATAGELAKEVERWLADEPVMAWREPRHVRVGRWLRRHQSLVAGLAAGLFVLLLLGGAGSFWWGRERERQRSAAEGALAQVARLQEQARWPEARAILEQTESRLGEFGSVRLRERLRQARADLDLVARLDAIRVERARFDEGRALNAAGADRNYTAQFAEAGLATVGENEEVVARRIAGSKVRQALLAALDDWADVALEEARRAWVLGVARRADPHPLRDRLRDPAVWQDEEKLARLVGQVNGAELSPALAVALGWRLGERAEGETLLRQAQQASPADFWLNFYLASVLSSRGKLQEGEGYGRAALSLRPDTSGSYYNLAVILTRRGKTEEAVVLYRKAIEVDPKLARAYTNLGLIQAQQGNAAEAERLYRKAIEVDPNLAQAHSNLGGLLNNQGRLAEAEEMCRKAVELDPTFAPSHNNLGSVLDKQGKPAEAEKWFRKAIAIDSTLSPPYSNLGALLSRQRKWAEAEKMCRKAIELDSKNGHAHYYLAMLLKQRGKPVEAEKMYRQAIKLYPTLAQAYYELGKLLQRPENAAEVERLYRQAVKLDPKLATAHNDLGALLSHQGKLAEAETMYRKALEIDPRLAPLVYSNLGAVFFQMGRWAESAATYRKSYKKDELSAVLLPMLDRMAELEPKLPAYVSGDARPRNNEERLALIELCQFKKFYRAAVQFSAGAFAADGKLADDLKSGRRYNASCYAALAAAGKGEDAGKPDDKERTKLRMLALDWLRADLALWSKQLQGGKPADRKVVYETMRHWQTDEDLAGVRDKAALAALPEAERQAWERLWADVAALLKKTSGK